MKNKEESRKKKSNRTNPTSPFKQAKRELSCCRAKTQQIHRKSNAAPSRTGHRRAAIHRAVFTQRHSLHFITSPLYITHIRKGGNRPGKVRYIVMADSLLELLAPHLDSPAHDATTEQYLTRLSTLSLDSLQSTEPQSLAQSSHSTLLSLQALSNRSHRTFITSADNLSTLSTNIPQLTKEAKQLRDALPKLDEEAVSFSTKYSKITDNAALERRKKAMQLARNVDRLSDILELPTLLSTAVSAADRKSVV